MLDLLCMGRAAVDFYSQQIGSTLEEASSFAKYLGGCPANIAVGVRRLGLKTGILSRVGDEAMGRFVRKTFEDEGVDTCSLRTDPSRLTALVLLGIVPPDHFPLIFYRENCADMAIDETDFSLETFQRTRAFLITGTHCSSDKIFAATRSAVHLAVKAGAKVILDIDYRPVLWGVAGHGSGEQRFVATESVAEKLKEIIPYCDLVVGTEEEILIAGGLDKLLELANGAIVEKKGANGCAVHLRGKDTLIGEPFPVDILNVLGAGDAFMSGFLRGYLKNLPLEECARLGNANGALVVTRHGCSPAMPFWNELQYFIQNPKDFSTTARIHDRDLCLLAFDHCAHFEKLADHNEQKIKKCKHLLFEACSEGLLVDAQYSLSVLQKSTGHFVIQSVEKPDEIDSGVNGIKITVSGSDDKQIKRLKSLYEAAKQKGLALLIDQPGDLSAGLAIMEKCYRENIFPSWWRLPPCDQQDLWKKIEHCIEENDPLCLGILVHGNGLPFQERTELLLQVKSYSKMIKGFAAGRSIWDPHVRAWMQNEISDKELVLNVSRHFTQITQAWRSQHDRNKRNPQPEAFFVQADRAHHSASADPLSHQSKK